MDIHQVGCLSTERSTVVDNLELDLLVGVVDGRHFPKLWLIFKLAQCHKLAHHRLDLFPYARFEWTVVVENG